MSMKSGIVTPLMLLASLTASGFAGDLKLAPELVGQQPGIPVNVIVQYKVRPGAKHQSNISKHGGNSGASLDGINGLVASMPANQLKDLATDPDITYISP